MEKLSLEEKWIDSGRGKIFYFLGPSFPGRPTVVFLHGLTSNHTTWLNDIRDLGAKQYNCLAPDLRGHGFSDQTKKKSHYQIEVFTEDLKKIIERENINKFVLVGYSFGGTIAIDFALKNLESLGGLVLISANHANHLKYRKVNFLSPLVALILNSLAALLFWQKRKNYIYYQHGASRGYWHSVWIGLNSMPLSVNMWMLKQAILADFQKDFGRLAGLDAPGLIVRGEHDPFLSKKEAEDMVAIMPRAKMITLSNSSHFIASDYQSEVSKIIFDFLSEYENSDF